jgi:hypothetical protein
MAVATLQNILTFAISSSSSVPRLPKARIADSTTPSMPFSAFRIFHSSHSIWISIPPSFRASCHSDRNLLSCQISSPALRYAILNSLFVAFCGAADRARERMEDVISQRAFVAFFEVMGMVDKVCCNRDIHVLIESECAVSSCSKRFKVSWCAVSTGRSLSSSELMSGSLSSAAEESESSLSFAVVIERYDSSAVGRPRRDGSLMKPSSSWYFPPSTRGRIRRDGGLDNSARELESVKLDALRNWSPLHHIWQVNTHLSIMTGANFNAFAKSVQNN